MGMRAKISNVITITAPSPELLKWCKSNLTLSNPDFVRKQRMGFWTGNTPKEIRLYERHGDALELPYGVLGDILPMLHRALDTDWPTVLEIDYGGTDVPLYDYQQIAVEAMYSARYGILVSPAGSGKTQMGVALIKRYSRPALWLTHTKDLLIQSRDRATLYMDPSTFGTITEGRVEIGSGITFATVQTMCKTDLTHLRDMWDVVVVDEVHHAAGSPTTVTQFYKVLNALAARHKYGLTATAHRSDGLMPAVYSLIGPVQYTIPDVSVADKIMRVGIMPIQTGIELTEECQNPDGTLNYTSMVTMLTQNPFRNTLIADTIAENIGYSSLILSDRIEHLEAIMNLLPDRMREDTVLITGKMTSKRGKAEREMGIERMRSGLKKYLFATYQLAKEGLDIPCLERLYLTTPVKDEAVVIQSIGRIARTFEGKTNPVAYDFVDDIRYCERAFRQRMRHYKRIKAKIL